MRFLLPALLGCLLLFSACGKDTCEQTTTYTKLTPVLVDPADFRALPLTSEAPRELRFPGKIYSYGNLLLINERNEGIHFIDNSDKTDPQAIAYLPLGGNTDFVIRNGILYANHYTDLVSFDVSDPLALEMLGRTENVRNPLELDGEGRIATYYNAEEVTETVDCDAQQFIEAWGFGCWNCDFWVQAEVFDANFASGDVSNIAPSSGVGTGGSMARFTVYKDRLYTVDDATLRAFTFTGPTVEQTSETQLWWGIETIIPYNDHLFIGSQTGMFIYEASDPDNPTRVSVFQHARACDPVYVKDDYAYVTLRDGTPCAGFANQLDLVDISDMSNPRLAESFQMQHPHGLGILDESLFVCEGDFGLKAFDISDPLKLDNNRLWTDRDRHTYDVIPLGGDTPTLLVVGDDGFLQLDISNAEKPVLLSTIPVTR